MAIMYPRCAGSVEVGGMHGSKPKLASFLSDLQREFSGYNKTTFTKDLMAGLTVAAVALPPGWWGRLAFSLGAALMIGWLAMPRPEGDYVVSKDWQGYAVLGLALTLLILGVGTLPRPRARSGD